MRIFLGSVYARSGRVSEALPLLERAAADSIPPPTWAAVRLGEGYLLAGQVGDATAAAERQLQATRDRKELGNQAWALWLLGDIALRRDSPEIETAEDYYRHAVALAEELGMRPLVGHCHLGLGKLYRRTGKREQAQEHLTTATTMYREMDMRFWLEKAEVEMRYLS